MKVMWVCNQPNESASVYLGRENTIYGGWLSGLSEELSKTTNNINLVYCYPGVGQKEHDDFVIDNVHYYSFYAPKKFGFSNINANKDHPITRRDFKKIFEIEKPDILHIFGTEYTHALISAQEFNNKDKIVCSIQGLVSVISDHYLNYIPKEIFNKINFSSIFRKTLWNQKKDLEKRGMIEVETLNICNNVVGRTDWDKACTYYINSKRFYYHCNETLRNMFYDFKWEYNNCQPYTIFFSQGSSPLKGLNIMVEALALLKQEFPSISLRIAGNNFVSKNRFIDRLKISTYGEYILSLIDKYNLSENIIFLGNLNESKMIEEYLRCNVFVSSSSMENSSNSVCEAMLLGVPIVSSNVGGISSLATDNIHALLYPGDDSYMLAWRVKEIFNNKNKAIKLGINARTRAKVTHDKKINNKKLINVYNDIIGD